jgi:cell wall-associated NlpC family hydrolase
MQRAKHRAAGTTADVLATTLIERLAVDARPASVGPRHDVTIPERPSLGVRGLPLVVPPLPVRPQPVGATLGVTVFGAAAAITAVVPPPLPVETTMPLAPARAAVPASGPAPAAAALAAALPAPARPVVAPERPTVQVSELVNEVTGEMQKLTPTVEANIAPVARSKELSSSPAAMRKAAVSKALSKIGKPYRWGATGPNAFDCSGLVQWSFEKAGRTLPRTSKAMAGVGAKVSKSSLQPGDLVFFYKPISHVGIYIGNGKIVHASNKKSPVKVSDIGRMPLTTARRV